jgi:hypothetical protein
VLGYKLISPLPDEARVGLVEQDTTCLPTELNVVTLYLQVYVSQVHRYVLLLVSGVNELTEARLSEV